LLKATLTAGVAATSFFLAGLSPSMAADHGDGPLASVTRSADLGDVYLFLDPNNNNRVVAIATVAGFTPPGEAVNFSVFDHRLEFEFQFETTFDARPDQLIRVRFSRKRESGANPQTATITLPDGETFQAPTTSSSLAADPPEPTITTGPEGIRFFAGSADDPFFFDIPGFNRFVASALGGTPDTTQLERGRDTFAGYNILTIALSIPVSFFGPLTDDTLGLNVVARDRTATDPSRRQIDQAGNPGVNVVFVPFDLKDVQNRSSTVRNTRNRIPAAIVGTLEALGTEQPGIDALTDLVVTNGDFLRVDTTIANTGPGGGDNEGAGFPNGRRLGDDVIDFTLGVVTNNAVTSDNAEDDTGDRRRDEFPFLAPPIQPFPPDDPPGPTESSVDDLTQN
jgi:hypothetical protein